MENPLESHYEETEFAHQVRDALNNLYNHSHLQRHPLADSLVGTPSGRGTGQTRAQTLRRILLDAIEALNPGTKIALRAHERRSYAILFGSYVEKHTWKEIADTLGISERQFQRERTQAIEALATILHDRRLSILPRAEPFSPNPPAAPDQGTEQALRAGDTQADVNLRRESERLAPERSGVDIQTLFSELIALFSSIAEQHQVQLQSQIDKDLATIALNRTLVRNLLISQASLVISGLAKTSRPQEPVQRTLSFDGLFFPRAGERSRAVAIGVTLRQSSQTVDWDRLSEGTAMETVETLTSVMGGRLSATSGPHELSLHVVVQLLEEILVLVVDDNVEMFALYQRYTARTPYRLIHASNVPQAREIILRQHPDLIILDLMMPEQDGWELLANTKNGPRVKTPMIVCSAMNEPQLAYSLGAQFYLKKPVDQGALLSTLDQAVSRLHGADQAS